MSKEQIFFPFSFSTASNAYNKGECILLLFGFS